MLLKLNFMNKPFKNFFSFKLLGKVIGKDGKGDNFVNLTCLSLGS